MVPLSPRQRRIQQLTATDRARQKPSALHRHGIQVHSAVPLARTEDVAQLAFHLYLERGALPGDDWADWFRAETILKVTATPPPYAD